MPLVLFTNDTNIMDNELKIELEKILEYLKRSNDSIYSYSTVEEIKNTIYEITAQIDNNKKVDKQKIKYLIAPTGSLQEISIDNGWGEKFVTIASKIDEKIAV